MKYFEVNLPQQAPYWAEDKESLEMAIQAVTARHEKLEQALVLTGMRGEDFAAAIKPIFTSNAYAFDRMSVEDIAKLAEAMKPDAPRPARLTFPNTLVLFDTAFATNDEWVQIKRMYLSGSSAAAVTGRSKWVTALDQYKNMVYSPKSDPASAAVFDRGHFLEERVIQAFADQTGATVYEETRMFRSKDHPWCAANIDAIVGFSNGDLYVFEAKTTVVENADEWYGNPPIYYIDQCRQYPAVLNEPRIKGTYIGCMFTADIVLSRRYLGSSCSKEVVVHLVPRAEEQELALLTAEERFCDMYVSSQMPPEDTGSVSLDKVIEALNEKAAENPKDGNAEFNFRAIEDDVTAYLTNKAAKKTLEDQMKPLDEAINAAKSHLIEKLDGRILGTAAIDDETYIEIKNSPRSYTSIDREAFKNCLVAAEGYLPEELFNALASCMTYNPDNSRTFSLKEKKVKLKKAK